MEEPSFISNSESSPLAEREAGRSILRTIVIVLAVLIACEVALRVGGWPRSIPYELGGEEYNAVAAALNRNDAPEVMVVGSSRAREAVNLPLLKQVLSQRAGRDVTVGSCAVSGAHASDVEAIVSRAMRTARPPKVILYGIAERDFNRTGGAFDKATAFWNLDDWKRVMDAGTERVLPELATVVRTEIGRHFRVLGQREQIRLSVRQALTGTHRSAKDSLIYGQLSDWQRSKSRQSLQTRPARRDRVLQNIRDFQRSDYPDAIMVASLRRTIAQFGNGDAKFILFEVPPSRAVKTELNRSNATIYPSFLQTTEEEANGKPNVAFYRVDQLGIAPNDRDFREMAHLNLTGATKFTNALANLLYPPPATQPTTHPSSRQAKHKD